jgi:hypothetical protein
MGTIELNTNIRSPEEHRKLVESFQIPANDSEIVPVVGWPTMARYKKNKDIFRAKALKNWADLCQPVKFKMSLQAANDNAPKEDGWDQAIWAESFENSTPIEADRLMETRPTEMETMAALFRVSVTRSRSQDSKWSKPKFRHHQLEFRNGKIVAYYKDGRRWVARTAMRGEKGASLQGRKPANIMQYLDLAGTPHVPQWRTHDGARWVEPTKEAERARQQLQKLGVDGDVPTDKLPFPVTIIPAAIAKGAHWWGGTVAAKKTKQQPQAAVNVSELEAEMDRYGVGQKLRDSLDHDTREILDCAISPMTATEVGELFGKRGKYAERWAVKAIDEAVEKIAA